MKVEMGTISEFQIEKFKVENKPVMRPRMIRSSYPFDKMKVGQSFYFEPKSVNDLMRIRSAASQYAKRNKVQFSIIQDGEGYRCGRIV